MHTLPEWWLFLSGTFYTVMIIVFSLIAYILMKFILQGTTLLVDVRKIVEKVDRLVDKAEFSIKDVSEIAKNINRLSSTVTEKVVDTTNRINHSAQKASLEQLIAMLKILNNTIQKFNQLLLKKESISNSNLFKSPTAITNANFNLHLK